MGCDCFGYIEALPEVWEPDSPDAIWFAVVNYGVLVGHHYVLFCRLFGVRCGDDEETVPLAPERGLPANPSKEVKEMADMPGLSWATLDEVEQAFDRLPYMYYEDTDWGWKYILESMRLFGEKYGRDHVRLVMGFDCP